MLDILHGRKSEALSAEAPSERVPERKAGEFGKQSQAENQLANPRFYSTIALTTSNTPAR